MDKYTVLIDGIANAIAEISEVGEEGYEEYNQIVRKLSKSLAAAAKLESGITNQCGILVDAIAWTISELLDSIDSGCTSQQGEIIGNLAKALAAVAKSNISKPQALLMAGA